MLGRILRGALVGAVLGLLVGVALGGAMYMYNYMNGGVAKGKDKQAQGMVAQEVEQDIAQLAPVLNVNASGVSNTSRRLIQTLRENGIAELAKQTASQGYIDHEGNDKLSSVEDSSSEDGLSDNLIRFHIRANSDSEADIALKLKVRDAVIERLEAGLVECETIDEAESYLEESLELIEQVSRDTLAKEGYNYAVEAYLTEDYFPARQYGEMVLPAGFYQALRVDIGLANGENFWCLLYPTLCVPVEAGGVITKDGEKELEEALTEEQYEKLFIKKEVPKENIEIRFKLWDMIFGED